MIRSRTITALVGLAASLLVSVVAWYYLETFLLFLFVPFVPFLLRGRGERPETGSRARQCPECGFTATDPGFEYCPRHGRRLE